MSSNNPTLIEAIVSSPQPEQRNLLYAAIVASFLIYLIAGAFRMLVWKLDFMWAFFPALIYWVTTLPFTFLATFVYRRAKLPSRFELPAVILIVGIGLFIQMTIY